MEIIMTEQGNKSWASRQFHLELFPTALNLVIQTLTLDYHNACAYVPTCIKNV